MSARHTAEQSGARREQSDKVGTSARAKRTLREPEPPAPEIEPADNPHRCESCGRGCAQCAAGDPCYRLKWCPWCANAYAENPPAGDGRVYCLAQVACDPEVPFPPLARLIEAGLTAYPRACKACREAEAEARETARRERAELRELDKKIGADAVASGDKPLSDPRDGAKPTSDPRNTTRSGRDANATPTAPTYAPMPPASAYWRGGFTERPREAAASGGSAKAPRKRRQRLPREGGLHPAVARGRRPSEHGG